MATGEALLAILQGGSRHGYDLKHTYDEWFAGLRPLAFGQVYSTLSRLQRDDLVQVAQVEDGDGPERIVYAVTEAGRAALRSWLGEPVEPGPASGPDLQRKVLVAHRLGLDLDAVIARQRAAHLVRMRELGGLAAPIAVTLSADHTRLALDAELRWLDLAAERLGTESQEVAR